jgi:NaMN:DMB phosphoribosyltransferase
MSLASDPLPTDPDALRAFAATLQAELARRDIEIAAHAAEIHAKTLHIEKLKMHCIFSFSMWSGHGLDSLPRSLIMTSSSLNC